MHLLSNCGTKQKSTFFSNEDVKDPGSIAPGTACAGTMFCEQLPEKTVCFYLMSSLLNETRKRPSLRMKVVEDLKLSYDRYRNLVSQRTWLPTFSSVALFMHLLSNFGTKQRNYFFFQTKLLKTLARWLPEPHVQVQCFANNYQIKQCASICCQVC